MVPTRKTVYSKPVRSKAQTSSEAQKSRQVDGVVRFLKWLHRTSYKTEDLITSLTQKTSFVCKTCGTERNSTPSSMWRNDVAPKCGACAFDAKLTKEYVRVSSYGTRVVLKHKCGAEKEYVAETFLRGNSKCDCLKARVELDPDKYRTLVAKAREGGFAVEQDYVNSKTPIWHRHISGCGKRFKQTPGMFLAGTRCPLCETGVVWTEARTRTALIKKCGKNYEVVKPGADVRSPWKLKHLVCGKTFSVVPEYVINKSQAQVPCPFCQTSNGKFYTVYRQRKRFQLQGTESLALDHILSKGIKAKDIVCGLKNVPKIEYQYEGKSQNYYPDFHVDSRNILVEAKDVNSFGLGAWFEEKVYERNCAKAEAVISSGYQFRMLVFKKGELVPLPRNWWKVPKQTLIKRLAL